MRRLILSCKRSATDSCTSRREPAQQTWPWLNQIASTNPSTALSRSESSNTMNGDLPPEFERQLLAGAGSGPAQDAPDLGRAGESQFADFRVMGQRLAGLVVAQDQVEYARVAGRCHGTSRRTARRSRR